MSFTAREQQELHAIEDRLASSDPGLAPRLAIFTRLVSGEEMPGHEKIDHGWRALRRSGMHRRQQPGHGVFRHTGLLCQRLGWRRAMLLLCLIVAVVEATVIGLAVGLNGPKARPGAPQSCTMVLERLSGCR